MNIKAVLLEALPPGTATNISSIDELKLRLARKRHRRNSTVGMLGVLAVVLPLLIFVLLPFGGSDHSQTVRPGGRAHVVTPPDAKSELQAVALPGSYTAYVPIAGSAGPIAISPDGRTAYVGNRLIGQVVPVDLPSGRAQRPITLGDWPINAIAITPDGRTAYVVEGGIADAVIPIDLATRTVGPAIDVPGPRGLGTSIAMAPNGRMAYVDSLSESDDRPTSRQTVTITHTVPSYVVPIDLVTDKALRPISLEPLSSGGHTVLSEEPRCVTECGFGETIGGIAITADGRTAYVSDSAYGSNSETKTTSGLFSIELSTEQVSPEIVTTGAGGPLAITPDGQFAYVASDYTVTSIDLGSNTAGPSLSVVPPGEMLSAMAITPDGATLIAAGYSEIGLINLHSGKVESLIQSPGGAVAIAPTP